MRRFIILALFVFCILVVMIFAWAKQSGGPDGVAYYQKIAPFSKDEMTWQSATRSLLSDGIVLYQPTFPKLRLRAKVERLTIEKKQNNLSIRLSNGVLDAGQTLLDEGPVRLTERLKGFARPVDFLLHPMEAMVLLNQDVLKGNAEIILKSQGKQTVATIRLWKNGHDILQVRGRIQGVPNNHLWGWIDGSIQNVQVVVSEASLLKAVAGYLMATRQTVPAELQTAIRQGKPFQTSVHLSEPYPIKKIFLN